MRITIEKGHIEFASDGGEVISVLTVAEDRSKINPKYFVGPDGTALFPNESYRFFSVSSDGSQLFGHSASFFGAWRACRIHEDGERGAPVQLRPVSFPPGLPPVL